MLNFWTYRYRFFNGAIDDQLTRWKRNNQHQQQSKARTPVSVSAGGKPQ
jgi:hypothetical protein